MQLAGTGSRCRPAAVAALALSAPPHAHSQRQQQRRKLSWRPPFVDHHQRSPARGSEGSRRLKPGLLAATSSSEDEPVPEQPLAGNSPVQVLEVERQSERALAYGGITALLGAVGLALAVDPSRAVEFLWGACPTLVVQGLARVYGSMLLLAAVCANCLKEAAEKDLLRSDTYKRLNLGLLWWGLGTALALWLAPQQPLRYALGACTALLAATSAHAALTFHETSEPGEGFNPAFLIRQFFSSLGNLGSYTNSADSSLYALYAYGLAAKATIAAAVAILFHGQLRLAQDGLLLAPLGALGTSFLPVNGVGYALAALVLHTLKDAAARGRLGASTFKALNIGVAVVAITNALTIAAWMQAGVLASSKLVVAKVAAHSTLAAVCLYNYAFAKKKKGH